MNFQKCVQTGIVLAILSLPRVLRAADTVQVSRPSVAGAYLLSFGGTAALTLVPGIASGGNMAIGVTGVATGLLVGPSLGQYYAGSYRTGSYGILARIGGAALMTIGGYYESMLPVLAGLVVYVGGASYSISDIRPAVERAGRKAGHQAPLPSNNPPPFRADSLESISPHTDTLRGNARTLPATRGNATVSRGKRITEGAVVTWTGGALVGIALFTSGFGFDPNPVSNVIGTTGAVLFIGGAIYTIYTITGAFLEKGDDNMSGTPGAIRFDVYPTLSKGGGGSRRVGMMAKMSF